jgi:phage-related protein
VLPARLCCKQLIFQNIHSPQGMVTLRLAKAAVKTVSKPAAKKAAPVKPVAKAAKKVEKDSFSKTKTDKCNIEVRCTISGVRKRLGYASSEAMKAKVIAKAKAAA